VIADAGKVRRDNAIATNGAKPGDFALGPASINKTMKVKNTDTGASSMNTSALFIAVIS
jgi:hypothetical protein